MTLKTNKNPRTKMRKGMAMLDLILTIGVIALAVATVIWMWSGAKNNMDSKKLSNKTIVVITGVEKAKSDYNNDAYIATSVASIPSIAKLRLALGGTKATKALSGWTYACSSGVNSIITITSENIKDVDIIDGIAQEINAKYTDWVGSRSGFTLVLKRINSNCQ